MCGRPEAVCQLIEFTAPGEVDDVEVATTALGKCLDRGEVDRAGTLAAAHDQKAARVGVDSEPGASSTAIGRQNRGRNRAPGEQVAPAAATGDRKGQTDPAGAAGEQAVGETKVAVCLGQDERHRAQKRGQTGGPGDETTAAHHNRNVAAPDHFLSAPDRHRRLEHGECGAQRVVAIDSPHPEKIDLIACRRNDLCLDPIAGTEKADLGSLSPKLVGDRDRRHDVACGSPRCD